jgi:predicted transglutaminase-like cysteine proteinase
MSFSIPIRLCAALLLCALPLAPAGAAPATAGASFLTARATASAPRGFGPLCTTYSWLCATSSARDLPGGGALALARSVNRQVNATTPQISDLAQYGVPDHWALPTARGGDCEDIAMLKKERLVMAGYPAQDLLIATVLDRGGENHAVLVARTAMGDFVLDNLRDAVLPWQRTRYTFLTMQNPSRPSQWEAVLEGGMIPLRLASN